MVDVQPADALGESDIAALQGGSDSFGPSGGSLASKAADNLLRTPSQPFDGGEFNLVDPKNGGINRLIYVAVEMLDTGGIPLVAHLPAAMYEIYLQHKPESEDSEEETTEFDRVEHTDEFQDREQVVRG